MVGGFEGLIRRISSVLIIFFVYALTACASNGRILELKDTHDLSIEQVDPDVSIKVLGLAFHSSLAVREIIPIEKGDTAQILVSLVPARTGLSGRFEYIYAVPPYINTVTYGTENRPIWNRTDGFVYKK